MAAAVADPSRWWDLVPLNLSKQGARGEILPWEQWLQSGSIARLTESNGCAKPLCPGI